MRAFVREASLDPARRRKSKGHGRVDEASGAAGDPGQTQPRRINAGGCFGKPGQGKSGAVAGFASWTISQMSSTEHERRFQHPAFVKRERHDGTES